jgi:hypothetical protein
MRRGDLETGRPGDGETWRLGEKAEVRSDVGERGTGGERLSVIRTSL